MARKLNNLEGWLRDVQHALKEGSEIAYLVAECIILLDDLITDEGRDRLLGDTEDAVLEDADEPSGEGRQLDLDLRVQSDRLPMGGPPQGHDSLRDSALAPPAGVGAAMERARDLASRATQQPRDADALASARGDCRALRGPAPNGRN